MRVRVTGIVRLAVPVLAMLTVCEWVHANGFRNPPEGAAALGMTGGKTALLDDASAVAHNPANLVNLEGPEFRESLSLVYGEIDYTGVSGSGSTDEPWKFLPTFFYASPLDGLGYSAGIAITTPYGQSTEWSKDGPFAFAAPYLAELLTVNVRPVVAFQLSPTFSVAAGPDFMYSNLKLKQLYPWGLVTGNPAQPVGDMRLEGDGLGVGGTVALAWKPRDGHRVGLTYHSRVTVELEGDLDVSELPAPSALPGPLGLILGSSGDFDSEITFPTVISLGYGYEVSEVLRVGVDLEWVEFSTFDELPIDVDRYALILPTTSVPQNWDDTWVVAAGLEYDVAENLTLRGGYVFLESPIPEETLAPTLPDSDRHLLTAGLGSWIGRHGLDVTYAYSLYDDLQVENNVNPLYNGEYDINTHLITLTYAYRF